MADNIIWSKDSIIQVGADTPEIISNATVNGANINMKNSGYVKYVYNFGTSGKLVHTENIQLSMRAQAANNKLETRYTEVLYININIRYWKEDESDPTGFSPGHWQTLRLYPYLTSESEGYVAQISFETLFDYIHTLDIEFCTSADSGDITFINPRLYYSISISEAIAAGGGGGGELPISVAMYTKGSVQGAVGYYKDNENPFTIKVEQLTNDAFLLNFSDKQTMQLTFQNGDLPWG